MYNCDAVVLFSVRRLKALVEKQKNVSSEKDIGLAHGEVKGTI